jgi:hypothetical protein
MYGLVKCQKGWKIRTSDGLQVMYRKPNIVTTIKSIRPDCAGHLVRKSDDRTVKKLFLGTSDGKERAVRLKLT